MSRTEAMHSDSVALDDGAAKVFERENCHRSTLGPSPTSSCDLEAKIQKVFCERLAVVRMKEGELLVSSAEAIEARSAAGECALCGSSQIRQLTYCRGMELGRCESCGVGIVLSLADDYTSPELDRDYSARYECEMVADKAEKCWELMRDRTRGFAGIHSVLDIGCGRGAFLDLAKRHGMRTAGIELSAEAAAAAVAKGHEVLCGSACSSRFPGGGQFDAVLMWDVLEHLDQPGAALRHALSMLAPSGQLLVVTPMMGSVFDRWGLRMHRLSAGRLDHLLRMCFSHDHVFRFSPSGLCQVLQEMGAQKAEAVPIQLMSLRTDRYAGGAILPAWTPSTLVNRWVSRLGVGMSRLFKLSNKVLVTAQMGAK